MFYDKAFSDYFSALSTAPAMFIIEIFNQHCRYLTEFWRCLGFVPNLNYCKGKFWKQSTHSKLQDQHNCLKVILEGISEVHWIGGIHTTVLGKDIVMKP